MKRLVPFQLALASLALAPSFFAQESKAFLDVPFIETNASSEPYQHLADYNNDGILDAIAYWPAVDPLKWRRVRYYRGTSSGTFDYKHSVSIQDSTTPDVPAVGEVGELRNPDGRVDFVLGYAHRVELLRSLAPPVLEATHVTPFEIADVSIGDWDGDGKGDVVAVGGRRARVFLHPSAGVTVERDIALGRDVWSYVETGDFTGDGIEDLLFVGKDGLALHSLATSGSGSTGGTGASKKKKALSLSVQEHGIRKPNPAVGDIDGDGDLDVVLFGKTEYRVFEQVAAGVMELGPIRVGGPATDLADVDADGDLDGVCCSSGGGSTLVNLLVSKFEISLNEGGTFAPAFPIPSSGALQLAGAADIDRDGDVDLVAGRSIYYSPGGIRTPDFLPGGAAHPIPRQLADVDNDGDIDYDLRLGGAVLNMGDGSAVERSLVFPDPPTGLTFLGHGFPGDFSGDGIVDLLVEAWSGASFHGVHLLRNSGGGSFVDDGLVMTPPAP